MRAALLTTPGSPLEVVDDVEVDDPGVGEVRVRIAHCGVCHSDLSLADGHLPAMTPMALGHEAAGVVEALGPGVTRLAVGDHVVLTPTAPCGTCYWCVRGEWSVCEQATNGLLLGTLPDGGTRLTRAGAPVYRGVGVGAFSEAVVVPATGAVRIDPEMPLELACVLGCAVQTGVGAVLNTARVPEGATVLVLGAGGVGLSVVQGAVLAGAATIVVSDPVDERRRAAAALGATHVVDPSAQDPVSVGRELTGGVGFDVAFDAAGRASLVSVGIDATRIGGTTVMVGVPPIDDVFTLPLPAAFAVGEKKLLGCLVGSCNSLREIPRLVDLWRAGRLDLASLVTARRPLAEVNVAFDDLRASRGVRTVIDL